MKDLVFSPYRRTYIDAKRLYFTSDTHFWHTNILKYCNRPFSTIEEMNEELIKRWNSVVPKDGIVIHCGDFGFATPIKLKRILDRLNGHIILVSGNHDNKSNLEIKGKCIFEYVFSMLNIVAVEPNGDKQYITCSHYPLVEYYNSRHGAWLAYGHTHGSRTEKHDVGVDNNDFYPISYYNLKEIYSLT